MSIDSDDGETVIQSEDGSTIIGSSSGELPDDFPNEVPMPMGIALEYTQAMSDTGGRDLRGRRHRRRSNDDVSWSSSTSPSSRRPGSRSNS